MWEKKIHIASSMQPKDSQYNCFIGRWQILHEGHKQLFNQVLDAGENVLIMIRDVEPDERNPLTATEVFSNLHDYYKDLIKAGRIKIIKIPDIKSINFGREVGYDIVEWIPPQEIAEISASKIRESKR